MDPILAYLSYGIFPVEKKEARKVLCKAVNYTLVDGMLYKEGLNLSLLRCLRPKEGRKVLHDLHTKNCSNHIKNQALYVRALWLGYYWST